MYESFYAELNEKGQITIPESVMDKMQISPGTKIEFRNATSGNFIVKLPMTGPAKTSPVLSAEFLEKLRLGGIVPMPTSSLDDLKGRAPRPTRSLKDLYGCLPRPKKAFSCAEMYEAIADACVDKYRKTLTSR